MRSPGRSTAILQRPSESHHAMGTRRPCLEDSLQGPRLRLVAYSAAPLLPSNVSSRGKSKLFCALANKGQRQYCSDRVRAGTQWGRGGRAARTAFKGQRPYCSDRVRAITQWGRGGRASRTAFKVHGFDWWLTVLRRFFRRTSVLAASLSCFAH